MRRNLSITIFIILVGLLALELGRYISIWRLRLIDNSIRARATLDTLVSKETRAGFFSAFERPEAAERSAAEIAWYIPHVISPFVDTAPAPGTFKNISIDVFQTRSPQPLTSEKPANTFRIFLTGGSYAFGSGAPSQLTTIGALLQERLQAKAFPAGRRAEVFTLAAPGWTTTHERIAIENRISELSPDMVLSLSAVNDVHWGLRCRNILWSRSYAPNYFWLMVNAAYGALGASPMVDVADVAPQSVAPADVAWRLVKNLTLSSQVLKIRGDVPLLFFLQPNLEVTGKTLSSHEQYVRATATVEDGLDCKPRKDVHQYFLETYSAIRSLISARAEKTFLFHDGSNMYDNVAGDTTIFFDRYHTGDRGNRIAAESLAAVLEDHWTSMRPST